MAVLLSASLCPTEAANRQAASHHSLCGAAQAKARTHQFATPAPRLFKAQSQVYGTRLQLQTRPSLTRRSHRASGAKTVALVNVEFNPALLLGLSVMSSGVLLYQLRQSRKAISRDTDLFISCICLCSGGILVFQGWRLDPLLLLCQLFTTVIALSYAYEALQARQNNAVPQVEERSQKADPRARSQQVYEYEGRGFELPPPANEDAYSQWARENEPVRSWQEQPSWQEASRSRGDYPPSQQAASRQGNQGYDRSQPAETSSSSRSSQNGYYDYYPNEDDERYDYDSNGYPLAKQQQQSNGYPQSSQRQRSADRDRQRSEQQDSSSRRGYDQDRDAYRETGSGQRTAWQVQNERQTADSASWSSRPSANNADDDDDWDLYN